MEMTLEAILKRLKEVKSYTLWELGGRLVPCIIVSIETRDAIIKYLENKNG